MELPLPPEIPIALAAPAILFLVEICRRLFKALLDCQSDKVKMLRTMLEREQTLRQAVKDGGSDCE